MTSRHANTGTPDGAGKDVDKSLTGRWIGRYDYDDGEASVPFEADMTQTGMTLRAMTAEPNTFRHGGAPELLGALYQVDALKAYNRALAATAAEEHS